MARTPTMIAISAAFASVLGDWLERNGQTNEAVPLSSAATVPQLTIGQWEQRVRAAVARLPGPARGLEIGSLVRLSHVGPLGYMAVNTSTLREFLRTYLLLEKWFYGVNWATATFSDAGCEIAWDARFGFPDRLLEQLHAAALATILRSACPTAGPPLRVDFMNAEAGEAEHYAAAFACPVRFDAPALCFEFSQASLAAPIDVASAALDKAWRSRQRTLREALPEATAFVRAVQSAIFLHLPEGAPAEAVAASLHLSRRTLQRRLAEYGCSHRQLLDGIREKHAGQLLNDPKLTLEEIAFLLGYAEQSAFNHAYRRWTGTAPLSKRP
jgi:AraC-like DNA-binding protein